MARAPRAIIQGVRVRVRDDACLAVARACSGGAIPTAAEQIVLGTAHSAATPDFYLALVAICHQTSPQGGPQLKGRLASGGTSVGWDYLRARLLERVGGGWLFGTPDVWRRIRASDLEAALADEDNVRTLADCEVRAHLLRDLGVGFARCRVDRVADVYESTRRTLRDSSRVDMYTFLAQFVAYADPVEKKSSFFLSLMQSECGWRYRDVENLAPPVDYHEVRGHLRLGTVEIVDDELLRTVRARGLVDAQADIEIRSATRSAITLIASYLEPSTPADLHYLFWNTFRACCRPTSPHCTKCDGCSLPERYRIGLPSLSNRACVFREVCPSAQSNNRLHEHQTRTHYY